MWTPTKSISEESLVIGALEAAFWETDQQIGEEKKVYSMPGGCTVLVALFILGKLYVANAGDSRAVLTRSSRAYPMSYDFTPVTERARLQTLGRLAPQLLGAEYTWLEYVRRPTRYIAEIHNHFFYIHNQSSQTRHWQQNAVQRRPYDWVGLQDHPGVGSQVPDGLWGGKAVPTACHHWRDPRLWRP